MEADFTVNENEPAIDLSVIIPVYNGEKYIKSVVEPVLTINDISYEIIIVDDGSTDGTHEIAEKMAEHPNVRLHSMPTNAGQSAARNAGISIAKGQYVTFLDVDDTIYRQIEVAVKAAISESADILHTSGYLYPRNDKHIHYDSMSLMNVKREFMINENKPAMLISTPLENIETILKNGYKWTFAGKIFRREFLLENGIRFPEDMRLMENIFFFLQCVFHAKRYILHSCIFYMVRESGNSLLKIKRTGEDLKAVLDIAERGLLHLDNFFQGLPSQECLSLAKQQFYDRMEQIIEPISLAEPEIWRKLIEDDISILHKHWWIERKISESYRNLNEKRKFMTESQEQKAMIAASDVMLDRTLAVPRIIVLSSVYTMLLCMLYFKDWEKSIFICGGGIPRVIIKNLKKNGIICIGEGDGNYIIDTNILQCISRYAERNRIPFFGNDDPPEAGYFVQQNFTVVEDGNYNYQPETVMSMGNVQRITASGELYVPFGFNRFIKHILITGKHPVPSIIKKKVKTIRIQTLWNQKPQKEQDKILDIYSFPRKKIEEQLKKGRDCLLLGVSSSLKGLCSPEQEIAMYKDIIEPYGQKRFIIKPHHQNIVEFKKFFPNSFVLPKEFPIDIVKLLGMEFHRVIGANCSALYSVFPPNIVEDRIDLMEKHGIRLFEPSKEAKAVQQDNVKEPLVEDECPSQEDNKELSKVQMYENLHKEHPEYGTGGTEILPALSCIIDYLSPKSILDYGCGKGGLVAALEDRYPNIDVYGYDPAVERFSSMPVEKADLVVCTDVLEHIPEEELPETIERIASISMNAFFHLHHGKAIFYLESGENAHCTIWTQEQYRELFSKYFQETFFLPGCFHINSVCVTFPLPQEIREEYVQKMASAHANILLQRMRR